MHHIKSNARQAAYADPYNPFGRRKPQKRSSTNRMEEGRMEPIAPVTSLPANFGDHTGDAESSDRRYQTAPGASMRQRTHEAGDDIVPEETSSPRASTEDLNEKTIKDRSQTTTGKTELSRDTQKTLTNGSEATGYSKGETDSTKRGKHNPLSKISDKFAHHDEKHEDNNGKDKPQFTAWSQIKATIFSSWINVLLILSPVGIAIHFAKLDPRAIFVVNFIAIIPLAGMLSYATEEIALRTGEVIGGLLNATFGNAVELIVSIIALFQDQFLIVQTSLLGSMLSNLLLVMGMCFFAGGINRIKQSFNITVAQTASSLLFLAVGALIIPTAFEQWAFNTADVQKETIQETGQTLVVGVKQLSDATAVILLFVYFCYLFFQLKSHVEIYMKPSEKTQKRDFSEAKRKWKKRTGLKKISERRGSAEEPESPTDSQRQEGDKEEQEEPALSLYVAIFTLAASTVLVALNAEFLVDALNEVTCGSSGFSKTFVGLILLPIVGNAAEHATAVTVAIKDKMDLAIGVAVGSSMQIALLVLPLVVIIGWIAGKDGMTLYFDGFQLAMLFVAVLLVNYLIQDGESHWLEGTLLMMLYLIIAVAAWFYPTSKAASGCPTESGSAKRGIFLSYL